MGSSLTDAAFFFEKISNSIIVSKVGLWLRLGKDSNSLGYATYNVLKFFIDSKPMITNDR